MDANRDVATPRCCPVCGELLIAGAEDPAPAPGAERPAARDVVVRWERLRLVYNGLLVAFVLCLTAAFAPGLFPDPRFWRSLVLGGIVANVGFCFGPAAELYVTVLGVPRRTATAAAFIAGTLFTALLATVCIAAYAGEFAERQPEDLGTRRPQLHPQRAAARGDIIAAGRRVPTVGPCSVIH